MKDIKNIVAAFEAAKKQGKKTALATVVNVNGSSYRRPGARMLVTEDGQLTGAISGGCLEGDALRKAVLAITQAKNKLVIYDTTDEDDAKLGIQLGCNGIVSVLFEPIQEESNSNPISILHSILLADRKSTTLISAYSTNQGEHFGTGKIDDYPSSIQQSLKSVVDDVLKNGLSQHLALSVNQYEQQFFIEFVPPPISLVIIGAGNDAMPLAAIAEILGWPVTLIDGRHTHAAKNRFQTAEKIIIGKPADIIPQLVIDYRTAIVLMTHNYNYDRDMLAGMIHQQITYLGMLGPVTRRDRIIEELKQNGVMLPNEPLQNIYGPAGLDLGAETAEEIAVSICAEIMAVMNQKKPIHLKQRATAIHQSHT